MDDRTDLQQRAEKLYPYRFPDKEIDLIEQYGTADDLTEYQRIFNKAEQLIKDGKPVTESDIIRLAEIRARAERRFFDETLHGDYELFKALVSLTVERYEPHADLYQYQLPEPNPPDWKGVVLGMFFHCSILVKAESFFGWDKVPCNEYNESPVYAALFDRAEQMYPGTRDEMRERAQQLAEWDRIAGFELVDDQPAADPAGNQPPAKRKQYHSIFPSQYVIQLDNATHMAFEGIANHVWNMAPSAKKPVNTYVSMYFEQSELDRLLDRVDGEIFRCVVSIMLAGNNQFTASNIWQTSCNDKSKRPSPKQFQRIYESLRRMQKITMSIDYSEHARLQNWDETGQIDAQFMPGLILNPRRNSKGQITEIYIHCKNTVDDFPLYMFAVKTGQIQRLPIDQAAVTGNISMTEQAITIRSILLERIVKNHRSKSDQTITFKSLYEKVDAQSKAEQKRVRDAAESLLLDYVKQGTIHGFAFRKKGYSFESILIAKTPEKKETFPEIPESEWTQRKL
jgi:hypothetical protein